MRRGRESEASEYSCAYELDLDDLDEGELTNPRLPDPPPEVKHAFRCAARGDVEGLEAALDADPSLLYALNRGGASLVTDVASERQRVAVVTLLRARENPARRRLERSRSRRGSRRGASPRSRMRSRTSPMIRMICGR